MKRRRSINFVNASIGHIIHNFIVDTNYFVYYCDCLFEVDGHLQLGDFGLAKVLDNPDDVATSMVKFHNVIIVIISIECIH